MKHEDMRELLALRLYGEIDDAQRERLEAHVASCEDCRTFAHELERGLGAVQPGLAEDDGAWIVALERSIEREESVRRNAHWWVAAAGFAAGFLAFWLVTRVQHPTAPSDEQSANRAISPYERFLGDAPPPRSDSRGELSRLGDYLAH